MKSVLLYTNFCTFSRLIPSLAKLSTVRSSLLCQPYYVNRKCCYHSIMGMATITRENVPVHDCRNISRENVRYFSTNPDRPYKLNLMKFELILLPSIIKTVKNWIFSTFIIRPYFDRNFSLPEFVSGAKYALEIVSNKLSVGDFAGLEELVTKECILELKNSISQLNVGQRQELAIAKDDIYFCFPYEVGVMFDESGGKVEQKRSVEITMVFHVLRGFKDLQEKGDTPPVMGVFPGYQDKIFICNYRFIRDYTKGVSDQWTINVINHFKPAEQAEYHK